MRTHSLSYWTHTSHLKIRIRALRGYKILELHYGADEIEAVKDEMNKVYYIYIHCYTKVPNCVWSRVTAREV